MFRLLALLAMLAAALALLTGCSAFTQRLVAPTATRTPLPVPSPTQPSTPTPTYTPTSTATPTLPPTTTPTPTATPTATLPPLQAHVRLVDPQIGQGLAGLVQVVTNRPCSVTGILDGRTIPFGSEDGLQHVAIIAVHALAPPGEQALAVTACGAEGAQVRLDTRLTVLKRPFDQESLSFSAEVAKLLDPQYTEPELARTQEIYATVSPLRRWQGLMAWPHVGPITSAFGTRRSYGGRLDSYHAGLDIDGETGDIVTAPAAGVVVLAEKLYVRGNAVILDHGWGVLSGYYHLDTITVGVGDAVAPGDALGTLGATGLVTGSHLHWELHTGGIAVDPRQWLEREFPGT